MGRNGAWWLEHFVVKENNDYRIRKYSKSGGNMFGKIERLLVMFVIVFTVNLSAREANDYKFRKEMKVTGKNLLLPVVFPDLSLPKEKQKELYHRTQLFVFVDGGEKLVHRQIFHFPADLKDVTYWGYLDMSEYVGENATIAFNENHSEDLLNHAKFSDEQGEYLEPVYTEKMRPGYHFTPKQGWNNDPNGLYYMDGLYHMSFQNGALNLGWGNIYWGHAVSKDLLHWEESSEWPRVLRSGGKGFTNRHAAMADGQCFSGGAVVDFDNKLGLQKPGGPKTVVIAYTDSSGRGECLAYSTDGGKRFQNMENNPAIVLPNVHDPKNKKSWGRDPKPFWHEPTKSWVIVTYLVGKVPAMCSGHFTFYTSKDMKTWEFASRTEKIFPEEFPEVNGKPNPASRDWSQKDFHECPDFFQLPVDGDENNKKWVLIGGAMKYQVGDFDGKTFTPDEKVYRQGMFGDMKAGQAFSHAPDGRVVYVLWSRLRTHGNPRPPFVQGMTLPVQFKLKTTSAGLRLTYHPIAEMASIRGKELYSIENQTLDPDKTLTIEPSMDTMELVLKGKASSDAKTLVVNFGNAGQYQYDIANQKVMGREVIDCPKAGETFTLRFFIDRAQWEAFFNDGQVFHHQARRDAGNPLTKINLTVPQGGTVTIESLKINEIKSVWKK
jgi:fructan beta-fructosidase